MENKEQVAKCLESIELGTMETVVSLTALGHNAFDDPAVAIESCMDSAAQVIKASLKLRAILGVPLKSEEKQ